MLIEQEIIDRIENINWFVNCGTPIHNSNIEVVYESNWKKQQGIH
ncbi:hypothetical protein [Paenibacillus woosongensis]|nr:hypothetical protein [Paenibacillus woosongensis]